MFAPVTPKSWEIFSEQLTICSLKKGEHLQKIGEAATKGWFICKGLARFYCVSPDGGDITMGFFDEGKITSSYAAFLTKSVSDSGIEVLEDTVCISFDMSLVVEMIADFPEWNSIVRTITEHHFLRLYERTLSFMTMNAGDRLELFQKKFPHLLDRLSQRYLASYLGISREALNRLLKSI